VSTFVAVHEASHDAVVCRHCRVFVDPVRPSGWWRVAEVGAWVVAVVLVSAIGFFLSGILWFFTIFATPVFFAAAGVFGPLHRRASAPPHCPVCERVLEVKAHQRVRHAVGRSLQWLRPAPLSIYNPLEPTGRELP
jgi:hypothetical protein